MTHLFVQRLKQCKGVLSNLKHRILRVLRISACYSECSVFTHGLEHGMTFRNTSFRLRPRCNVQMKQSGRKPALLSSSGDGAGVPGSRCAAQSPSPVTGSRDGFRNIVLQLYNIQ